ncbi:MAG: phosphoesterase RecJ-like protein [Myxococcota bacterium]|jgi:phosphoesterase RecJ-like protein
MHPADRLLEPLVAHHRILLTGPVAPDGDSVGACLALQRVLRDRGCDVQVAGDLSYRYRALPGAGGVLPDASVLPDWGAVVVLDGDRHRLTAPVAAAFAAARFRGLIDHHASSTPDGYDVAWISPESCSATAMLAEAFDRWDVGLTAPLAELLYAGIVFDTGGFRYSNTTPAIHALAARLLATGFDHAALAASMLVERREAGLRLAGEVYRTMQLHGGGRLAIGTVSLDQRAALGVVTGDLEGIVDALVHVVGVEVAALLVERPDGIVKYSLRSRGRVDLLPLARRLSETGGGHSKAAGATRQASLAEAHAAALAELEPAVLALAP